jgi:hypothetical protein
MSHLFKNNFKIYFKLLKIFFISLILFFTYLGTINYIGNKFIYLSFSIVNNFLLFFAFRKNSIFFETFFSILLWLGFWFKFTCTIVITDGLFREGVGLFDYNDYSFNKTLIVSQIGIISFIFAGFFREFIFFNYPKKLKFNFSDNNFFNRNKFRLWTLFIIFFLTIGFLNFYFKIYQKGLLPIYELNFVISGMFKWLLLFGLSTISSIFLFYEANTFKKFFITSGIIVFFETFISSLSMLSRGMIFNAFAIFFGIYKFSKKINKFNKISYYIKLIAVIGLLFYISVSTVNYIRANYFYVGKSALFTIEKFKNDLDKLPNNIEKNKKYSTISEHNSEILYLLINRWVGIDGVMAVTSKSKILSTSFLKKSFNERPNIKDPTFYELTFGLESINDSSQIYSNVKGNTLPGIIAFLFYSGSYILLFCLMFFITIAASLFEYLSFKLSNNNLIFSALIGQVVAFRLIHFGYLPHQSYLLFGTILLTIFIVFLINFFIKKMN